MKFKHFLLYISLFLVSPHFFANTTMKKPSSFSWTEKPSVELQIIIHHLLAENNNENATSYQDLISSLIEIDFKLQQINESDQFFFTQSCILRTFLEARFPFFKVPKELSQKEFQDIKNNLLITANKKVEDLYSWWSRSLLVDWDDLKQNILVQPLNQSFILLWPKDHQLKTKIHILYKWSYFLFKTSKAEQEKFMFQKSQETLSCISDHLESYILYSHNNRMEENQNSPALKDSDKDKDLVDYLTLKENLSTQLQQIHIHHNGPSGSQLPQSKPPWSHQWIFLQKN